MRQNDNFEIQYGKDEYELLFIFLHWWKQTLGYLLAGPKQSVSERREVLSSSCSLLYSCQPVMA